MLVWAVSAEIHPGDISIYVIEMNKMSSSQMRQVTKTKKKENWNKKNECNVTHDSVLHYWRSTLSSQLLPKTPYVFRISLCITYVHKIFVASKCLWILLLSFMSQHKKFFRFSAFYQPLNSVVFFFFSSWLWHFFVLLRQI